MFAGYKEHHSRDVYRILNLTKNSIINSREIFWLNKTYGEWKNDKTTIFTSEDDNIELPTGIDKRKSTKNARKDTEDEGNESDNKVDRSIRELQY
jgi:hypothetical protein